MMAPPLLAGGENVTDTDMLPAVAVPMVGAPGIVDALTGFDAAEAPLRPTAFVAVTEHVYTTPFTTGTTIAVLDGFVVVAEATVPPLVGTHLAV